MARKVEYQIKATSDFSQVKKDIDKIESRIGDLSKNKKIKLDIDATSMGKSAEKAGSLFSTKFLGALSKDTIPKMESTGQLAVGSLIKGLGAKSATAGPIGLAIGAALLAGFATVGVAAKIAGPIFQALSNVNAAYMETVRGSVLLVGATRQVNGEFTRQREVVNDSTRSYEERASALGLDTNKIYENSTATGGSVKINNSLNDSIKKVQATIRATTVDKEKEIKVLDRQLQSQKDLLEATKAKNEAELRARKDSLGFSILSNSNKGLESEITILEMRRKQLQLQGDFTFEIDEQLTRLKLEKGINDDKLEQIDQQTDAFKQQGQAIEDSIIGRMKEIENTISQGKLKIELDTAEAEAKLEDLQFQLSQLSPSSMVSGGGGGSTQVVKQSVKDLIDAQKDELSRSFTDEDVKNLSLRLQQRYGKYLTLPAINKSIANLLKGGADLSQAEDIFINYADAAASGKRETISFSKAMDNLTEAYAINSPTIGQYSGVTENLISQVIPKGIDILKQQYLAQGRVNDAQRIGSGILTEAEQDLAKYEGTMFYTNDTLGTFNDLSNAGTMNIDALNVAVFNLKSLLGDLTKEGFAALVGALVSTINWVIEFEKETSLIRNSLNEAGQAMKDAFTKEDIETIKTLAKIFGVVLLHGISLALDKIADFFDKVKEVRDQLKLIRDTIIDPVVNPSKTAGSGVGGLFGRSISVFSEGGIVRGPGTSTSDSIPAMLSNNEYVIKASVVEKFGKSFFDRINSGGNVTNNESNNTRNTENNYFYNPKGYRFANV